MGEFKRSRSKFLTKLKYTTTINLLYQAVQKVASDELAELQNLMLLERVLLVCLFYVC